MHSYLPRSLRTAAIGLGFLVTVTGTALPVAAQVMCPGDCQVVSDLTDQNGDRIMASDQGGVADDTFTIAEAQPLPTEAPSMPMQPASVMAAGQMGQHS